MFTCLICSQDRPDFEKAHKREVKDGAVTGFICKTCIKPDDKMQWVRDKIRKLLTSNQPS